MAISAELSLNLQPFTGNGDVSKWVKILEWDEKLQTNKQSTNVTKWLNCYFYTVLLHFTKIKHCIQRRLLLKIKMTFSRKKSFASMQTMAQTVQTFNSICICHYNSILHRMQHNGAWTLAKTPALLLGPLKESVIEGYWRILWYLKHFWYNILYL